MISLNINGEAVSVDAPEGATLLSVLTNQLNLNGQKYGCGKSQCGACMVLIDGNPAVSCTTPATSASGRSVTTLEGLRENGGPSPLQQAFIDEQAAQCGYCLSGVIISAQALLDNNPNPTESDIRLALNGNLCRCGSHNRIIRAVLRAAKEA
ncbi:MAG: (2Fe-2S)-binding protein [Albidovulum sp.]|nr:(2Fe-2S)-binding protein [Albidovulum sp.]MDE0303683.1 (2Fe-2S)-binding protein [Albidovulum sp.]MDE0533189.1 (2Fe-2S)-binding protein [Albidovulum sp.]